MTIVELIDAHDGFDVITNSIRTTSKRKLLWIIGTITFFLSALLDNLTTTIVMITLSRALINERKDRLIFAGIIVIAANAGGAWSPMGDVTTTMLWIGNQITAGAIIMKLILPSLTCLIIPLLIAMPALDKEPLAKQAGSDRKYQTTSFERKFIFYAGILSLLSVPVFKTFTHLPPLMGMLLSLGVMWIITEIIHKGKNEDDKTKYSVVRALRRIDGSTILFFLGILLCISALEATGILSGWAKYLTENIGNQSVIIMIIGLLSSIVDNVPLVAAVQGMYPLTMFPTDNFFWEFLAYATGTGGSILIIGSAAGVAAMGMEKIDFFWYLKKIGWLALIGYFAGCMVYILQHQILNL
jgi:Na+/H+ antiporter NhaD/arsenite permease-like protein